MKRVFNILLRSLDQIIVFIQISKMRITEKYALIKKHKMFSKVIWDKDKIQEFQEYWKINYGRKISHNGHKLYESINGVFNKDYVPDFLYATKIEPKFNSYFYAKLYSDKSLTEIIYSNSTKIKLPETYLVNSNGVFYTKVVDSRKVISAARANELMNEIGEAVIKPTIGGSSGIGVMICNFTNGYDKNNDLNISDLINSKKRNYIIQERVHQHNSINTLYPNAVNTIRAMTYILDGVVYCADLCLRIGTGGKSVDNIHSGGLVIGINNNGHLMKYAYKLGYTNSKEKFIKHPDTDIVFENYKIEGVENIAEVAKDLHCLTPNIGIISWDFSINENLEPVIIEANYWGQSVWIPQIVHGKPVFGEQTSRILNNIK